MLRDIASEPRSVGLARDFVAETLGDWEAGPQVLGTATLLVSELVTNAVRHVPAGEGDTITLCVERYDGHVRVEVMDRGPGFIPAPREESHDPGSGWGLHILAKLADKWGVESDGGARVWFELPVAETA